MEEVFAAVINKLQKRPMFNEFLMHRNMLDAVGLRLLQDSLLALEQEQIEQSKAKIFQYGSMVEKNDLLARQIFLYLLFCLEEQEQKQLQANPDA